MEELNEAIQLQRALANTEGDDESKVVGFVFEGEPGSKSQIGKGVFGRINQTKGFENCQSALAATFSSMIPTPYEDSVAIAAIFYRPNYQRIDADNMMKLVLDAGTQAGIWKDDCHVVAQGCRVEFDRIRPRTVIAIGLAKTSFDRNHTFVCVVCGGRFKRPGSATFANPPKTCSRACIAILQTKERALVRCAKCEVEFVRQRAGQKYCSRMCAIAVAKVRLSDALQRPWPKCVECEGRVSRREYMRCSNCSPKGRKIGSKNKKSEK